MTTGFVRDFGLCTQRGHPDSSVHDGRVHPESMLARFGVAEYHVMVLNSKYLADHLNGQRERSLCGSTSRFRHAGKKAAIRSTAACSTIPTCYRIQQSFQARRAVSVLLRQSQPSSDILRKRRGSQIGRQTCSFTAWPSYFGNLDTWRMPSPGLTCDDDERDKEKAAARSRGHAW